LRALIVGYSHGDLDAILLELRDSGFDVEHAVAESREDFRAAVAGPISSEAVQPDDACEAGAANLG
jgi:hypothetical protein